jgi:hypothetical protein
MMAKVKQFFTSIGFGVPPQPLDPEEHERLKRKSLTHEQQLEAQLSALRLEMRASAAARMRNPNVFLHERSHGE